MSKTQNFQLSFFNSVSLFLGIILFSFPYPQRAFSSEPSTSKGENPNVNLVPGSENPNVNPVPGNENTNINPISGSENPNFNPVSGGEKPNVNPNSVNAEPQTLTIEQLQKLARKTTVRIRTSKSAGSGVILNHEGETYTVLTNWHVVAFDKEFIIITYDGKKHQVLSNKLHPLAEADLAIVKFKSNSKYEVAKINSLLPKQNDAVYAVGFPLYQEDGSTTTVDLDIKDAFRFTQGQVSLLLKQPQSLPEGYILGYTNDIQVGMSGGPIFNAQGELIGVNGRTKHRDPAFGVYRLEDGTDPQPEILEQMINSSWGIPISIYQNLVSSTSRDSQ